MKRFCLYAVVLGAWLGCYAVPVKFHAYSKNSKIERLEDGKVRFTTTEPGKLFGGISNINVEPGDYELIVKAKSDRRLQLAYCADGWKYSPWLNSGDEIKEFRQRFYFKKRSGMLAILGVYSAGEVILESAELVKLDLPALSAVDVQPVSWNIADYPGKNRVVNKDGSVTVRYAHAVIAELPLPRTTKPIYLTMNASGSCAVRIDSCGTTLGKAEVKDGKIFFGPIDYTKTNGTIQVVLPVLLPRDKPLKVSNGIFSTDPAAKIPAKAAISVNGFVSVGKTTTVPSLDRDGTGYLNAVPLQDFRLSDTGDKPAEDTALRMQWDDKNLYLFFSGTSYSLRRLSNDITSFARRVENNDNEATYYDDCFVFLLHDRVNKRAYDFVCNANGKLLDTRMDEADLWGSRKVKWNSDAKIRITMLEGRWCAELAIPWEAMQIKPAAGMQFGFCAGRYDGKKRQTSTWNPGKAGYHSKDNLATLVLTERVPEIREIKLPDFVKSTAGLTVIAGKDARLSAAQYSQNNRSESVVSSGTAMPFVPGSAEKPYFYTLTDTGTSEVLVRTAEFIPVKNVRKLTFSPADMPLYLNGEAASAGAVALPDGTHTLAVKISGNSAKFTAGKTVFAPDTSWLYAPEASGKWYAPDFDDSQWSRATELKPGYYRKKLVINSTYLWPAYEEHQVCIPAGMVQMISLRPSGITGVQTPDGYRVIFKVDDQLEMIGASGCYNFNKVRFEKISGSSYAVTLPLVKAPKSEVNGAFRQIKLFFRAKDHAKGSGRITFYAETPDSRIVELPREIKVAYLPALQTGRPEKIFFQLWLSGENVLDDKALQEKLYEALYSAGINEIETMVGDKEFAGMWVKRNAPWRSFSVISMGGWGLMFDDYLKANPQWKAVNSSGKADDYFFCPEFLKSEEGKLEVRKKFDRWYERKQHAKHIQWDHEESVWTSRYTCYCQRCMKVFAEQFKLDKVPASRQELMDNYAEQWVTFTCRNFAYAAEMLSNLSREKGAMFSVYSGYHSAFARTNYSVDWSMLNGKIDLAMTGYGAVGSALDPTRQAVDKTPWINCLIVTPYQLSSRELPKVITTAKLVETVCEGTGNGTMIWMFHSLDGRTFTEISRASTLLAKYEKYFLDRDKVVPWKISGSRIPSFFFGSGSRQLGVFCNTGSSAAVCKVTLPDGKVKELKIVAGDAAFVEY